MDIEDVLKMFNEVNDRWFKHEPVADPIVELKIKILEKACLATFNDTMLTGELIGLDQDGALEVLRRAVVDLGILYDITSDAIQGKGDVAPDIVKEKE